MSEKQDGVKEKTMFFKKYLKQARHIGALLPSSRFLAQAVTRRLELEDSKVVVELGAGTGALTETITRAIPQNCDLVIVERDPDFASMLQDKFNGSHVWATEAQDMHRYLDEHKFHQVDCFVSGLPFVSLPKDVGRDIMTMVKQYLKPGGVFIGYSYFVNTYFFFKKYFPSVKIDFVLRNIPPAYVYVCRNEPENSGNGNGSKSILTQN